MTAKIINIAKDFSTFPFGRFAALSDTSGEKFRDELLVPALNEFEHVQVVLDGPQGYGSSFLEEAFGGLVRTRGFQYNDLIKRLSFVSQKDSTLIREIDGYMKDAQSKRI